MKKFLSIILVTMLCGIAYSASAQNITINGRVLDETGEYLPGANVVQKGTTNGTQTDSQGLFSLSVPEGATIVVSYIGYKSIEFDAEGGTFYIIIMVPDWYAMTPNYYNKIFLDDSEKEKR
jgi:hypothetical protein